MKGYEVKIVDGCLSEVDIQLTECSRSQKKSFQNHKNGKLTIKKGNRESYKLIRLFILWFVCIEWEASDSDVESCVKRKGS